METRANHLIVGTFALAVVGGLFFFVIWLAKVEIDREFAIYHIIFEEAVSGLSIGGDVRYNGIPVGTVTVIEIAPNDPSKVRVTAEIGGNLKIRTDTVAKLELQGITGVSYVQLSGGSATAPLLEPGPDGQPPIIRSQRSAIQELFAGAPELINRIIVLVDEFTKIVNEDNRKAFSNILANADTITSSLAKQTPEIERLIVELKGTSIAMRQTMEQFDALLAKSETVLESADVTLSVARGAISTVDQVMEQDLRETLLALKTTGAEFEEVAAQLNGILQENREPIAAFAESGLVEFTRFIEEARILVASTARLIEDLESDPAEFLFGGQEGGYTPP
jgi:phospholipid/cholesterol/gamma-HCH transport system substrate-binding protein